MSTVNQPPYLSAKTNAASVCIGKDLILTIIFLTWLVYSACVLGWAILDTPLGLACTNHIKGTL